MANLVLSVFVATAVNLAVLLMGGLPAENWPFYVINGLYINGIAALALSPVFVFFQARHTWTSLLIHGGLGLLAGCFAGFWLWLYQDLGWRLIGSGYEPVLLADIASITVLAVTFWRLRTWL